MKFQSSTSLDKEPGGGEAELSSSPATKEPFLRMGSKRKGKNLNPFSSSSSNASSKAQSSTEGQNQIPNRLMQLAMTKDKKEKKKKKGKGQQSQPGTTSSTRLCKENRAMVKVYLPVLDTEGCCYSVVLIKLYLHLSSPQIPRTLGSQSFKPMERSSSADSLVLHYPTMPHTHNDCIS